MKISVAQDVVHWEAAAAAVAAAAHWADEAGIKVNIAVVDSGGNLAAFLRMPGAFLHSIEIAIDKAYTAAGFGLPTAAWTEALATHSPAVAIGIPMRPRMVCFGGGLPLKHEGRVIGGIGVSGGSELEDETCARAGLSAIGLKLKTSERTVMSKDILNFINGEYVKNASGKTYEKRNPVDNSLIGMVYEAGKPEVDAAVAAARAALHGPWGKLSVVDRCKMLDGLVDEINHRFDDFLQAEIADTGKPAHLASHVDIPRGAANFKVFTDTIKNASTESFEMTTPDGKTARSYGVRVPRGVIAIICPWNLPLLLMTWKCGPAMACGNTVVVKPSEATPSTATLLGEVMNKVGVPKGVYNVVNGFGVDSAGSFLTSHPEVNGITFTGETKTGTAIMKAGADGIRPVSLELGGKNAAVVFADCDFDNAVATVTRSCFENAGQVCLGTERVYVERPIFERFVGTLAGESRGNEARPPVRQGHKDRPAGQQGASGQGAVLLQEGQGRRRDHHHRRRRADDARRPEGRLLGRADDLDRPARNRVGGDRRSLRPVLPHQPLRHRGGSA